MFGLSFVLIPSNDVITSFLLGDPFGVTEKIIWMTLKRAFLWTILCKRNGGLLRYSFSSLDKFRELVCTACIVAKHHFSQILSHLVSKLKMFVLI